MSVENSVIKVCVRKSSKTNKLYLCAVYIPTDKIICFGSKNIHDIFGVKYSVLEHIEDNAEACYTNNDFIKI